MGPRGPIKAVTDKNNDERTPNVIIRLLSTGLSERDVFEKEQKYHGNDEVFST